MLVSGATSDRQNESEIDSRAAARLPATPATGKRRTGCESRATPRCSRSTRTNFRPSMTFNSSCFPRRLVGRQMSRGPRRYSVRRHIRGLICIRQCRLTTTKRCSGPPSNCRTNGREREPDGARARARDLGDASARFRTHTQSDFRPLEIASMRTRGQRVG